MKYIAWIELIDNWKTVKLKRASNTKWYWSETLLKQIKEFLISAENWKLKDQFLSEYKEIIKIYWFFWLKIRSDLVYNPPKKETL